MESRIPLFLEWSASASPYPPGQVHVLLGNCHSPSVNRTQICVFEQTCQVGLSCLLNGFHWGSGKPDITGSVSHLYGYIPDQSLERCFLNEHFRAFLVPLDLPQTHRPWSEPLSQFLRFSQEILIPLGSLHNSRKPRLRMRGRLLTTVINNPRPWNLWRKLNWSINFMMVCISWT
jgi:hypothetical protein